MFRQTRLQAEAAETQAEADAGTADRERMRRSGPTVAPRNPAALNGSPAAAKVETLAAAVAKNRRENAPGGVLLVAVSH